MGGWGSGDSKGRCKEESFLKLDVRRLSQLGMLRPGVTGVLTWSFLKSGQAIASIEVRSVSPNKLYLSYSHEGKPLSYPVALDSSSCHYGGRRPWFLCPGEGCGARVAVLFGGRVFVCRHCLKLSYESQRQNKTSRLFERRNKLWDRIGAEPVAGNAGVYLAQKPKGMHWETFERLQQQALWAQHAAIVESGKQLDAIEKRMEKLTRAAKSSGII